MKFNHILIIVLVLFLNVAFSVQTNAKNKAHMRSKARSNSKSHFKSHIKSHLIFPKKRRASMLDYTNAYFGEAGDSKNKNKHKNNLSI